MPVLTITPQLRTTDLDRSIRFYTERVGLELEFRHADFYAGLRSGGGSFHLKLSDTKDPSIAFVEEGGHLHLYLGVDDVDSFGERLRAAGVDLIQPPATPIGVPENSCFMTTRDTRSTPACAYS